MIRVERDPGFWTAVAAHPDVRPHMHGLDPEAVGRLVALDSVIPLAAQHGGFIFTKTDPMAFICELHTLFTPEGWGREAMVSGTEALALLWTSGLKMVTTFETSDNAKSRPPKTFGFLLAGDWRDTMFGALRMWVLTQNAWSASPAGLRAARCR